MDELNLNAFKDYKSPFTKPECKGGDFHQRHPAVSKNDACPFHGTSAEALLFRSWIDYREEFAKEEDKELREMWLEEMLRYVTATNPPCKRSPLPKPEVIKTNTWYDIDGRAHHRPVSAEEIRIRKRALMSLALVVVYAVLMVMLL